MILGCLLSYKRPDYLAQTIESFIYHNENFLNTSLKIIALDQCASEETMTIFERNQGYFEKVYTTEKNLGIGWGFSQLVELSRLYKAECIVYLEDDWLCQSSLDRHLDSIFDLLQTRPDVGVIRLRTIDDTVATFNHVTLEPIRKERWQESFLIGNYHYVFNPHLVRAEVARSLIPVSGEYHTQIRYHDLGLKVAQLIDKLFIHIGGQRATGRISRVPIPKPVIPYELVADANEFVVQLPLEGSI